MVVAQPRGHGGRQRALAGGGRAVDRDHRDVGGVGRRPRRTASRSSRGRSWRRSAGRGCAPARRRRRQRIERRQRQAHRHAVVVVGVDAQRAASAVGGVTSMKSSPSTTPGAELAQLGGHRGDAVGLLDAPAGDVASAVVGPSAYSAITASVIAASGMWLQSSVSGAQRPGAAPHLEPAGPAATSRAHRPGGVDEADVALDRIDARRPRCAPARRRARRCAPSAMKYDADEASPSTWMRRPASGRRCRAGS